MPWQFGNGLGGYSGMGANPNLAAGLAKLDQMREAQLASRARQVNTLESMHATSPFEQMKKYIWASNEAATPQVQQQMYMPQQQAQMMMPQQQQPIQTQQVQQQQMPEWMQYANYNAPMNYYQQPSYYQQQPLNYGYGQQYLW